MSHPSRGGADSVRYTGSSARPRQAQMNVLDVDDGDPGLKPDAWFLWVMPTQTGVEMLPSGRYGYWEERPSVTRDQDGWRVEGKVGEPIVVISPANAVTAYVAQGEHVQAYPIATPNQPSESSG